MNSSCNVLGFIFVIIIYVVYIFDCNQIKLYVHDCISISIWVFFKKLLLSQLVHIRLAFNYIWIVIKSTQYIASPHHSPDARRIKFPNIQKKTITNKFGAPHPTQNRILHARRIAFRLMPGCSPLRSGRALSAPKPNIMMTAVSSLGRQADISWCASTVYVATTVGFCRYPMTDSVYILVDGV